MKPTISYFSSPTTGEQRSLGTSSSSLLGMMRMMEPLIRVTFGKRNVGFLANLKRLLEQEAPRV